MLVSTYTAFINWHRVVQGEAFVSGKDKACKGPPLLSSLIRDTREAKPAQEHDNQQQGSLCPCRKGEGSLPEGRINISGVD